MRQTTRTTLALLACFAVLTTARESEAATPFNLACPTDKVMTGLKGELGAYWVFWTVIGKVQPICRSLTAEGSWVDDASDGPSAGNGGGDAFTMECSPNYGVFAISGLEGDVVDSVQIQCFPLPSAMQADDGVADSETHGPEGGAGGVDTYTRACQTGAPVGVALSGLESGGVIEQLDMTCGPIRWGDVGQAPQPYFPENEATLQSLTQEFQWQPIVNAHNYHLCVTRGDSPAGSECNAYETFTAGALPAQFSYHTPTQNLSMGSASWGWWRVQGCNGAQECGPWSDYSTFLVDGGGVYDPDCACNTGAGCQAGCDCDPECECSGPDVTFFGTGVAGDLCSVYHNDRCQNCHSDNFRDQGAPTPPAGNHFPNVDAGQAACNNCHLGSHPNQWFTPSGQDFEIPCFDICQNLREWAETHDIAQHLSTGFDPRIEWGFSPSTFSSAGNQQVDALPAITEMTYSQFIATSQDWIDDGMCCAPGATGFAGGASRPDDQPGGDGGGPNDSRWWKKRERTIPKLRQDFVRRPGRTPTIRPPSPDPRVRDAGLVKAIDPATGRTLTARDRTALRQAGLTPNASRAQVEAALASLRTDGRTVELDPRRSSDRLAPRKTVPTPESRSSEATPDVRTPVTRARPDDRGTPATKTAPDERAALEKRATPDSRAALDKQVVPDRRSALDKQVAPEKRSALDTRVAPEKRSALEERGAPEKRAAPGVQVTPEKRAAPGVQVTPEKRAAPGVQVTPEKRAAPGVEITPEKRAAPDPKSMADARSSARAPGSAKTAEAAKPAPRPAVKRATSRGRSIDGALVLRPDGGARIPVTLEGSDLDQVTGVRVLLDGRPVSDIRVQIRRKKGNSLDLEFEAARGAKLRTRYEIELETASGTVPVPPQTLKMKVRDGKQGRKRR